VNRTDQEGDDLLEAQNGSNKRSGDQKDDKRIEQEIRRSGGSQKSCRTSEVQSATKPVTSKSSENETAVLFQKLTKPIALLSSFSAPDLLFDSSVVLLIS
jgi:hypothetical protein